MSHDLPKWFYWQYKLHQITGLIALRGNKLDKKDLEEMANHLRDVLTEVLEELQK